MWKTHGWPACAILVWLIITIPHYPHLLANPLGPYEKFRATDWWKWWNMIKNEKTRDIHHFWFLRCSPEVIICLSCFYQFSFVFKGNRGKWLKIIRKWKKKTMKTWKNSRHSPFLFFFRSNPELIIFSSFFMFYQFYSAFQENKGKWIKTIRKWWKMFKKWKLETFTIFGFFRCSPECIICLSFFFIFYQFSFVFQGNRGKGIKTKRKFDEKLLKKTLKNDKQL